MLPLYKIRFTIQPTQATSFSQIGTQCLDFVKSWLNERQNKPGDQPLREVEELDRSSTYPQLRQLNLKDSGIFHSVLWRKQDSKEKTSFWVTTIDIVSMNGQFDFQLQLGIERSALALQAQRPKTGRPKLIPKLLSYPHWDCLNGSQKLSVQPVKLSVRETERLCEEVLFAHDRELPVVVVTPHGRQRHYPVKPLTLAERLGGTAKVIQVTDSLTQQVLDQFLGKVLAIGPFGIRVFGPGLVSNDSLEEHWHFLGETIRAKRLTDYAFSDFLFRKLAERALPRFRESPLIAKFRQLALEERHRTLATVRAESINDRKYYEDYATTLEKQGQSLESENADLKLELERRDEQIRELERELAAARENIHSLSAELGRPILEHAEAPQAIEESLRTVHEIVKSAADSCPDLEFLDSALKSAADVPPNFKFTDRVAEALRVLQESAAERNRKKGRIPSGWRQFFSQHGFEYKATISDTALNQYGDDYHFLYNKKREVFDEHFTIGTRSRNTCISLHFSTRLRKDRIVLAHIGQHLRNTQS